MKVNFKPYEKKTMQMAGQYIYVADCVGSVVVSIETSQGYREYELERMDMIRLNDGFHFKSFEVFNNSDQACEIALNVGTGTYTPSRNKQEVTLTSSIEMTVEKVSFNGAQPVYQPDGEVFTATVSNLPDVQKVEVTNSKDVQTVSAVHKRTQLLPLPTLKGSGVVSGNEQRKTLIIKADPSNIYPMWIGEEGKGIPLFPSDRHDLDVTGAVTITALNNVDNAFVMEINYV